MNLLVFKIWKTTVKDALHNFLEPKLMTPFVQQTVRRSKSSNSGSWNQQMFDISCLKNDWNN